MLTHALNWTREMPAAATSAALMVRAPHDDGTCSVMVAEGVGVGSAWLGSGVGVVSAVPPAPVPDPVPPVLFTSENGEECLSHGQGVWCAEGRRRAEGSGGPNLWW